jgi:hypothetical protein
MTLWKSASKMTWSGRSSATTAREARASGLDDETIIGRNCMPPWRKTELRPRGRACAATAASGSQSATRCINATISGDAAASTNTAGMPGERRQCGHASRTPRDENGAARRAGGRSGGGRARGRAIEEYGKKASEAAMTGARQTGQAGGRARDGSSVSARQGGQVTVWPQGIVVAVASFEKQMQQRAGPLDEVNAVLDGVDCTDDGAVDRCDEYVMKDDNDDTDVDGARGFCMVISACRLLFMHTHSPHKDGSTGQRERYERTLRRDGFLTRGTIRKVSVQCCAFRWRNMWACLSTKR